MVTCPHCAHQGYRAHFATQGQTASLAPGRRQVFQRPLAEPQTAALPLQAAAMPQQPAWQPPPAMPLTPPPPAQAFEPPPEARAWRHAGHTMPTAAMQPATEMPRYEHDEGAASQAYVPAHMQGTPFRHLFLGALIMIVAAGGFWVWWDSNQGATPPTASLRSSETSPVEAIPPPPPAAVEPEIRRAAIPTTAETAEAIRPPVDVAAVQSEARKLVETLFQSTDPASRQGTVNDGPRHAAEIEDWFAQPDDQKPKLTMLSAIKGVANLLPGGEQLPLLNLVTSRCPEGALIRLVTEADGTRRIDWPLLRETHDATLRKSLTAKPDEPVWAWVLLKPSHGFEISAVERPRFHTFAMHVTADGRTPLIACVEKDTPLGRYLDRETDWGQAYLCHVLTRRAEITADGGVMLIVDCEGAAAQSALTPP